MNSKDMAEAKAEAERFLAKVNAYANSPLRHPFDPSPERAAVKRSSMDLTRALARMRASQ